MSYSEFIHELEQLLSPAQILTQEPMKQHTTFRIGGPAKVFVSPADERQILQVVELCRQHKMPFFILGNGSNVLVSDEGFDGVVIRIGSNFREIRVEGNRIVSQAGALLSQVAKTALEHELTGMEFAAGIPGTLGGACIMNAGAYGGEMCQILSRVTAISPKGEVVTLPAEELSLGYRTSRLMKEGYIVLQAELELKPGSGEQIKTIMDDLKSRRAEKQPLEYPSAGSTFKRPEGCFAGKLIQDAGLRGYRVGDAMVSEKHCGFVINAGSASAEDVCRLIRDVQQKVFREFGKELECEIRFLGFKQ